MTMMDAGLALPLLLELTKIGVDLDPATPVYRITDFWAAAQALRRGRLHLTRVDSYKDPNEAVDRLVRAMVLSATGPGCGAFGAHDEESARTLIEVERSCRFVSCWSTNPESHAMWAMYSPDQCSVRLETTVGDLQHACATALHESLASYFEVPLEKHHEDMVLVCQAQVLPVQYTFIHDLLKKLDRRNALARRLVKDTTLKGLQDPGRLPNLLRREEKWKRYFRPGCLKDKSYEYESEIRIEVRLGWEMVLRDRVILADILELKTKVRDMDMRLLAGALNSRLSLTQPPPAQLLPPDYSIPFPREAIASLTIDPRAPKYKQEFTEGYFSALGIQVKQSLAFARAFTGLSTYPDPTDYSSNFR